MGEKGYRIEYCTFSGGTEIYRGDDGVYAHDIATMLREEEPSTIGVCVVTVYLKKEG